MKRLQKIAPILLLLAFLPACIHKSSGAITPWERVHTYNAALADANNALEKGAEAAVSSNLLQPAQAAPIINWTGRVALLHQQITSILATKQATSATLASVSAVVDQIKATVDSIPAGDFGIKNPKSQQTFKQDFDLIYSLADKILESLQTISATTGVAQ
jgi:hypothetical protein